MSDPDRRDDVARVVLLGMMGAGKTTVGRLLAERLGWTFLDLDRLIERRAGRSIPRIFAEDGEPGFRAIETACTAELSGCVRTVLASGGGWITTPGNLELLGPYTLSVWLQVSPAEAVKRLSTDGGERPLLASSDPEAAILRLSEQREAEYARADITMPTAGRSPSDLARDLATYIRPRLPDAGSPDPSAK